MSRVLVVMMTFAAAALVTFTVATAQEVVKTADGRTVEAIPEPTFMPADVIAVARVAGLSPLLADVKAVIDGLAPAIPDARILEEVRRFLLSGEGMPGVHMGRPMFLGVYAPKAIDQSFDLDGVDDVLDISAFGVIALPVTNEILFRGSLGAQNDIRFVERRKNGISHFVREVPTFDFASFSIALEKGEVDPNGDLSRFNRVDKTDIFYRAVENYILLTSSAKIADDLAGVNTEATWRVTSKDGFTTPIGDLPVVKVRDTGTFFHNDDAVVISFDLPRIVEIYNEEIFGTLEEFKGMITETMKQAHDAQGEGEQGGSIVTGVFDLYIDLITNLLKGVERVEVSCRQHQGGVISRMTMKPIPGSEIEPWLTGGGEATREHLVGLLPTDSAMAMSLDYTFDDALFGVWRDIAERFVNIPNLGLSKEKADQVLEFVEKQTKNYTGRIAMSLDLDAKTGFSMVQVAELNKPDPSAADMSMWVGKDGVLMDLGLSDLGIAFEQVGDIRVGDTAIQLIRVKMDKVGNEPPSEGVAAVHGMMRGIFDGMQIATCVHENYLVMAVGKEPLQPIADVFDRIKNEQNVVGAKMKRALAPFPTRARMVGYFDMLQFMKLGFDMVAANPNAQGMNDAMGNVLAEVTASSDTAIGFHETCRDGHNATSVYVSKEMMLTFKRFAEGMKEAQLVMMTTSFQNNVFVPCLQQFKQNHDRWPTAEEGLAVLFKTLDGKPPSAPDAFKKYLVDAWGRPFEYAVKDGKPVITSRGRDGRPGGDGLDADLVATVP